MIKNKEQTNLIPARATKILIQNIFKKYVCSKLEIFYPPTPLVCPCYFGMYRIPPQCTFIFGLPPLSKNVLRRLWIFKWKIAERKQWKELIFFVESKDKRLFFIQSDMQWQWKYLHDHKKNVKRKKNVYAFLIKNHLYMLD